MMKFESEATVLIRAGNTRVFGHGGHADQIHNEVYEWLRDFVPGPTWTHENWNVASENLRRWTWGGKLFLFRHANDAMLFKLTWGGE